MSEINLDEVLNKCLTILNSNILNAPISNDEYWYQVQDVSLKQQKHLCSDDRKQLESINIEKVREYFRYLKRLNTLVNNKEFANIKGFSTLKLPECIKILLDESAKFINEYDLALKNANNGFYSASSGLWGEETVKKELELYKDRIHIVENLRIEEDGLSVESDLIVICSKGVFCIEVKNYGSFKGGKIIISSDGKWTRLNKYGELVHVEDITAQVYRHIGITQRVLNEILKETYTDINYIEFKPIICIANKEIDVENNSTMPVLRKSSLYHYISSFYNADVLSEDIQLKIKNTLETINKGGKKYPYKFCGKQLTGIYAALIKKLDMFNKINDILMIEQNLINIYFANSKRLLNRFTHYKLNKSIKDDEYINSTEIVYLRAYIDRLSDKTGIESDLYEILIKYTMEIDNISKLSKESFNFIINCFKEELNN